MNRVALLVRTPAVALYDFDHPPAIAHCDPEGEVAGRDSISVVEPGTFRVRFSGGTFDFPSGTMFLATRGMEFPCTHDVEVPIDRCVTRHACSMTAPASRSPVMPQDSRRPVIS